jgi:hypothetical protein
VACPPSLVVRFESLNRPLRPPVVHIVGIPCEADTFSLEHARDGPGAAADFDSRAAEPLEDFDAGPVDKCDARQIETHRAIGSMNTEAFALQQGGALRDDAPLEPQQRPGA